MLEAFPANVDLSLLLDIRLQVSASILVLSLFPDPRKSCQYQSRSLFECERVKVSMLLQITQKLCRMRLREVAKSYEICSNH